MSVTPISGSSVAPLQQSSSTQNPWQNMLNSVSSTLGLSTSALQQQLQSGQSLTQIAQNQGVSQQTLVQSISSALQQNGSTAPASQLQQIATNIANRTPGAGGHHHHHHHGGGVSSSTQQSADGTLLAALSTTPSDSTDATNPDGTQSASGLSISA